jgi:hypothetical protein
VAEQPSEPVAEQPSEPVAEQPSEPEQPEAEEDDGDEAKREWRRKRRNNKNPVADAGGDRSATVGEKLKFDAKRSKDPDGNETIKVYRWDFGDGGTGNGIRVSHTYEEAGDYVLSLTIEDEFGAVGQDFVKVTVGE